MSYVRGMLGRVYWVRWLSAPEASDLGEIFVDMQRERARLASPLFYLSVISVTASVPTPPQRKALDLFAQQLARLVEHTHLVLEGDRYTAALQRQVHIGLNFWGAQRDQLSIHASLDDALRRVSFRVGIDREILAAAIDALPPATGTAASGPQAPLAALARVG
jgi:hypothetical protein